MCIYSPIDVTLSHLSERRGGEGLLVKRVEQLLHRLTELLYTRRSKAGSREEMRRGVGVEGGSIARWHSYPKTKR